jgi:hypothetical protein
LSYIDDLLAAYAKFVGIAWPQNLAPPQRVWMAVYPAEHERRLRLHLPAFQAATNERRHPWALIDITTTFESWMADHEYREDYFANPELLETALPAFFDQLVTDVRAKLTAQDAPDGVVALLGGGALFGLGGAVKVSALINAVSDAVAGRLLVFFPGEHEGSNYRLLDARDGWNYQAVPITPNRSSR